MLGHHSTENVLEGSAVEERVPVQIRSDNRGQHPSGLWYRRDVVNSIPVGNGTTQIH